MQSIGSNRVNRGGSWNSNPSNSRVAYRNNNTPSNTNDNLGFRVVLAAPAQGSGRMSFIEPDRIQFLFVQDKDAAPARGWYPALIVGEGPGRERRGWRGSRSCSRPWRARQANALTKYRQYTQ